MTVWEALVDGVVDIRTHPGRTLLQVVGVLLGVGSIVAVLTLVDSSRRQSVEFFAKFGGLQKLLVYSQPPSGVSLSARERAARGLTRTDVEALRRDGTLFDVVDPVAGEELVVARGRESRQRHVNGVTPAYARVYDLRVAAGRFIAAGDLAARERVVVLGDAVARRLFGGENPVGKVADVGGQGYQVVGVLGRKEFRFTTGGQGNALDWMNWMVLVPLDTMTLRVRGDAEGRLDYVNVLARDVRDADRAQAEIERILLRAHGGLHDFAVRNRLDRVRRMNAQFLAFNVTFIVSAAVSLLVGGIVITNILLASFKTRVREVGVRKALGASPLHVFVQFLAESVVATALAGVLGLGLGWAFTRVIAEVTGAMAPITGGTVLVALAVALATGVVFGFHPALLAARLPPVEALRYE